MRHRNVARAVCNRLHDDYHQRITDAALRISFTSVHTLMSPAMMHLQVEELGFWPGFAILLELPARNTLFAIDVVGRTSCFFQFFQ